MSNVINFNEKKEKLEILKKVFKTIDLNTTDYIEKNDCDDKFVRLYEIFKDIEEDVFDNSWLGINQVDCFINNLKKLNCNDNNKLSLIMEYIVMVDASSYEVLKKDQSFIYTLTKTLDEINDAGVELYEKIYMSLDNKIVEKIISNVSDDDKVLILENVINLLLSGNNIIQIEKMFKRDENKKESKINDFTSVDEIKNYYQKYMLLEDKISLLNDFNNITKNKFIKMVNDIKNENYGSLKTVQLIKDLTDIFLYLNDDINVYSIDTIKCILFYKNVNNVSSKEATNVFKEIVYVK